MVEYKKIYSKKVKNNNMNTNLLYVHYTRRKDEYIKKIF